MIDFEQGPSSRVEVKLASDTLNATYRQVVIPVVAFLRWRKQ